MAMLRALVAGLVVSAWGWSSPHPRGFLHADNEPEEVMGPNLNFQPVSTSMKCIISLTVQYITVYIALGICRTVLDFRNTPHSESAVCVALKHASETMFYFLHVEGCVMCTATTNSMNY